VIEPDGFPSGGLERRGRVCGVGVGCVADAPLGMRERGNGDRDAECLEEFAARNVAAVEIAEELVE